MSNLPKNDQAYWIDSTTSPGYPELDQDINVDVAIVGAGIVGLTSAYLLKKAGLKVVVLEKGTVGAGVSGHTTGKITSQHNLIYAKLQKRLGKETARIYGEANQSALELIAQIIEDETIDCDFRREDNYVYTADKRQLPDYQLEAEVAASLGLPARFETSSQLPFEVAGSVRFTNQATFHVRKYLLALAKLVDGDDCQVFENTRALRIVDGTPGKITAPKAKLTAEKIIVATNVPTFPLMARGSYCVAEYPKQSYIVAGKIDRAVSGMYISTDKQHYSILPVITNGQNYLLIGGEGHIPGTRLNQSTRYQRLADYAKKYFGVTEIDYTWSDYDYLGYDDMPLIGKLYPWSKNTYTATGFMKWGMTNGTMAAMLLSDLVQGQPSPWADTFTPHRSSVVTSIPKVIGENL